MGLSPQISFATQGACSYHGGVNCSVGPAFGGKVMCNDGWVNSSVNFSDAMECRNTSSCPSYVSQQDYNFLYNQYNSLLKDTEEKLKQSNKAAQSLCYSQVAQNYNRTSDSYQSCMNYKQGLHLLYIQNGGMDKSLEVVCNSPSNVSNNDCSNLTSPSALQYLKLIEETKREMSCLKVLPNVSTNSNFKSEIEKIADEVRNRTPEQVAKDNQEICKKNAEMQKNDPKGFEEYKKNLEILGIPMTNCTSSNKTLSLESKSSAKTPVIKTPSPQIEEPVQKESESHEIVSDQISTPKPSFWRRVGSFLSKIGFW